ncbi:MAG TPA: hypothetical protein VI759_01115 [Dehalococcoidia bacterium]|nr:hypothetical protein [Dehalococcoidia bacterium]
MTLEEVLIAIVRLLSALPVLWFPFFGGVLALLVDQSDLFMMNLLHLGGVHDYQAFDKYLDQAYMLTFLIVALRWQGRVRTIAVALYVYRFVGFVAFEFTQERDVLLAFPNFFEPWFLFVAADQRFALHERLSRTKLAVGIGALAGLKLFQEFAIHQQRWLDGFTAVDAVKAIWRFLTPF